ncbi:MAG: efflux RND transporter periplasmic adaptor subunit [Pseudomonadota bacterium]
MSVRSLPAALLLLAGLMVAPHQAAAQGGPMPVEVASPLIERIVDWDEFTGRFEAVGRVELRARVSGYLNLKMFEDGKIVEAGDVLYVIDPRPFEAELASAQAQVSAAKAEQTRADIELQRAQELRANNTVAQTTVDQRLADKLRADAEVAIAEAAVRTAELNLDDTEVKAPFTGRISESAVDVGNLVTSGETVLATIVSTDPIHLSFTASEADFLKYSRLNLQGQRPSSRNAPNEVQAKLADEDEWSWIGRMDYVANEINPNAGTITGRAVFDNPDGILTPGLFARLRLIGSGAYDALLVPDAAILSDQDRKIVMLVDQEGTVRAQVVTLGPLYRGLRVIRSGITGEDRLVINGVQRARPGGQVVPQEAQIAFPDATN